MGTAHLDDERVLKHGISHDPQPLVLHARLDVGHGQGPPRGWADLADRAAHRRLLLPSRGVVAGGPGFWHPGGHGESASRLDPARFSGGGPVRNSEGPSASPGTHHPDAGVDTGRRAPSGARRPHLAQPPRCKEQEDLHKPLWFLRASSGRRAADSKRRENQDHPLRKNGTVRFHGDRTPTAQEQDWSIYFQETFWRPPKWTCFEFS